MAYELVSQHGGVVDDFYDVDGERGDLGEHDPPQRVCGLEIEVLDDEVGALVIGLLSMAVLVGSDRLHVLGSNKVTKRAVYLEEAHVDCAAFWVVIHRVLGPWARGLSSRELFRRAEVSRRLRWEAKCNVLASLWGGDGHKVDPKIL